MNKATQCSMMALTMSLSINASEWDGGAGNSDFNNPINWSNDQAPSLNNFFIFPIGGEDADFNAVNQSTSLSGDITTPQLNIFGGSNVIINTGTNELTISDLIFSDLINLNVQGSSSLEFLGNLRGSWSNLNLSADADSTLLLNGNIQSTQPIIFEGGGNIELLSAIVSSNSGVSVAGNTELTLSGTTDIQSNTQVNTGSTLLGSGNISGNLNIDGVLSLGESGNGSLFVDGDVTGSGSWIFDAVDAANRDFVSVSNQLDLSQFTLNLSGLTASANANGPLVIANYGSLTGGQFSNVTGLLPGQQIDYNFMGNQIAIIPEASRVLPVALAFLPAFFLRSRQQRK